MISPHRLARSVPVRATAVGVVTFAIGVPFIARPSLWFDEAITVSVAQRSIPDILHVVTTRADAVHGLYYLLMHAWFSIVPYSPFTLRLPSAVVIALAAAGVTVLASQLVDPRAGLIAGLAFALLPRITFIATEGRSYGLFTALAVWSAVLLLTALRRRRAGWWIAYAAIAALSVAVFVYCALAIVAHLIAVLWSRQTRGRWWVVALCGAAAAVIASPVVWFAVHQTAQVDYLEVSSAYVTDLLVTQFFMGSVAWAVLGWGLALCAIVAAYAWRRAHPGLRERAPLLMPFALTGIVVPAALVVGYSVVRLPLYDPRYLSFTAPFLAVLVGTALSLLRWRWVIVAGVALAVSVAPEWIAQRAVGANHTDLSVIAATIARVKQPGDEVYFVRGPGRTGSVDLTPIAYPDQLAGLPTFTDPTAAARLAVLDVTPEPAQIAAAEAPVSSRVLFVQSRLHPSVGAAALAAFTAQHWTVEERIRLPISSVLVLVHDH